MNHAETAQLFNDMYHEHYPRLLRNISKFAFDCEFEEREDIAQETFRRVWEALNKGQYEGRSSEYTWIFKIAIGASQRLLQQKQRQIPSYYENPADFMENNQSEEGEHDEEIFTEDNFELDISSMVDYNTPETVLIREQEEQSLEDNVESLSEDYREILAMHYYDGKTYEEISIDLSIPIETVRTRLRRARELLKPLLGEQNGKLERHEGGKA